MLRFRAFGVPVVEDQHGKPVEGAARQRRVLALLAIVAAGRHRGVSRDRVLGLLWSESEPERARQALTQSLYHTRKALGSEDVFLASADLRLDPHVISTDVNEFEEALETGHLTRAVELYEGPYLDGFYVNAAPEFERWVSDERARLRNRYAHTLEALASAATTESDHARIVEWRRRLAALDPLNSRYALELMGALAAAGDRAGAIKHAQTHEALLRDELDASANPAIVELAERLRNAPLWKPTLPRSDGPNVFAQSSVAADAPRPAAATVPNVKATRHARRRLAWLVGGVVAALTFIGALLVARRAPDLRAGLPENLTVVTPFRVSGADPALAYLREGLVDLLVAKLIDDSESPAVDAGAVMTAWRRAGFAERPDVPQGDALRIARQLGGTRLLVGSVVGTPSSLVVNATLLGLPDGELRAQASAGGSADSLTAILDRLVARLLAKEAGEWERLANRTSTSVVALRAYLDGQAAYRRGAYRDAVRDFRTALERDASFAMAGLALANAAERLGSNDDRARGLAAAWAARRDLTMRDSVYLDAIAGPHYPGQSSPREQLGAWERAAAVVPDRADVWHELGERLFFDGRMLAVGDWATRAAAAFRRSVELDAGFASPLQYLVQLAAAAGDTVGVRLAAAAYLRVDSIGDLAPFVRWRSAIARGDSAALRALRGRLATFPAASLRSIVLSSQFNGISVGDAERALVALRNRAARGLDRADVLLASHALALNLGKLDAAMDATESLAQDQSRSSLAMRLRVLDALYGGADSSVGRNAVARLTSMRTSENLDSEVRGITGSPNEREDACVLAQWRAWTERPEVLAQTPVLAAADSATQASEWLPCASLVSAIVAVRTRSPDSDRHLARFDSLLLNAPHGGQLKDYAGLALARLYATRDDIRSALAAVRRRPHMSQWPHYLAAHLSKEGQLAAANSDIAGAALAYRHYLELRRNAVGSARDGLEAVRALVAELEKKPASE